ncbi:PEP-CTERM/exosortase system-associated acyltransferase [Halomonas urumqiensis]|uniref:PEP-CTERM/exosortase system-associated acyltransferase n=1 Tax=Halomonas urumqiensis TaxID=1684789 RepID=A0A2N7UMQ3_9GAMM|nr:PEP-CTERM/exosortase system-associated acyltransferase [Halomonas urumqiensis]PMR81714.1 PEP-CTERM/exosortase system-associated acyltransferase [Halomonas urumqiensis]PTB02351.1 PEP-CTERM/exosortase system-associated acyltransferase [Halomonas urumqiensis]GHE21830.1 hypothetical protein GCM10017767_23510 [Halomonas urumqiensis]
MTIRSSSASGNTSLDAVVNDFKSEFRLSIPANARERERAFRLRHDVYCEELKYEPPTDAKRRLEYDEFDSHAIHCIIEHLPSAQVAGCMRVVLKGQLQGQNSEPHLSLLPLQAYARQRFTHPSLRPEHFPRHSVCEVSRLAVSHVFRKHRSNVAGIKEEDVSVAKGRPRHNPIPVGLSLFFAATAVVGMAQRQHVFAMMEPRFARLLKMSGLAFERIGELIDYHGPRAPFYIDQHQAERYLPERLVPLYEHIQQQLRPQLTSAMPHAMDTATL